MCNSIGNSVWACHPERPQGAKDLLWAFARHHSLEILRRYAPQNDMLPIGNENIFLYTAIRFTIISQPDHIMLLNCM
jgi:hypothetical protein